jgi:hypothetical protein
VRRFVGRIRDGAQGVNHEAIHIVDGFGFAAQIVRTCQERRRRACERLDVVRRVTKPCPDQWRGVGLAARPGVGRFEWSGHVVALAVAKRLHTFRLIAELGFRPTPDFWHLLRHPDRLRPAWRILVDQRAIDQRALLEPLHAPANDASTRRTAEHDRLVCVVAHFAPPFQF